MPATRLHPLALRSRTRTGVPPWAAALVVLALAASPGVAPGMPVSPVPVSAPQPASSAEVTVIPMTLPGAPETVPGCLAIYDNTANFTGLYNADTQGREIIDDLHCVEGGSLCSFTFGYNHPGSSNFQAIITFYVNDGIDSPPYTIAAGPYVVTGLPPGTNSIVVTPPLGPVLGSDVWMGVQFSNTSVGLLIADPPVVGSSHDYYYADPPGDYFYFGGNPRANYYLRLDAESAVPTGSTTWGLLKSGRR